MNRIIAPPKKKFDPDSDEEMPSMNGNVHIDKIKCIKDGQFN